MIDAATNVDQYLWTKKLLLLRVGFLDLATPSGSMCEWRRLPSISSRFAAAFVSTDCSIESRRFRFLDVRVDGCVSGVGVELWLAVAGETW